MRICWDDLEGIYLNGNGNFKKGRHIYIERNSCKKCGNIYLTESNNQSDFCSRGCSRFSKKRSEITKGKTSNSLLGNRHSKESIRKMSEIKIGKKHISGEKHYNWKGGISLEPYCLVFKDNGWRQFIYERDKDKFCWNPQCQNRGSRECLHHINYNKKDCRYSNIIKICNSCNIQANTNRDWWKSFYREIMRRRKRIYEKGRFF